MSSCDCIVSVFYGFHCYKLGAPVLLFIQSRDKEISQIPTRNPTLASYLFTKSPSVIGYNYAYFLVRKVLLFLSEWAAVFVCSSLWVDPSVGHWWATPDQYDTWVIRQECKRKIMDG